MKKALSLFLATLMLISVFSVCAFAATTPELTSVVAGYYGVELEWSSVAGAAGYAVFRQDSSDSEGELIKEVTTESYIDGDVVYGKTYKYVIAAKKSDNTYSEVNFENGVKVTYNRIKVKSVYNNYDGVNLTWNAVAGAKNGYRIFKQVGNAKPAFLADVKTTSYVDADVTYQGEYKYAIVSLDSYIASGDSLDWNNAIEVTYDLLGLKKPTCTNTGIVLEWDKIDGAEYEIYRKSNKAGDKGALIGTTNQCTYKDYDVEEGVTYTYCVVVTGAEPDYANGRKVTHQVVKFSKPVSQFDGLKIEWTAASSATTYYLYRDGKLIATLDTNSYLDKDVVDGLSYKYSLDIQYANGMLVTCDYDELVDPEDFKNVTEYDYKDGFMYLAPTCSRVEYDETIKMYVHNYYTSDKVVIDVQPTVYNVGYRHYVCPECGRESTKKVMAQLAPKTPEIISLHNTNLGVKITWEVVDGADLYVVYRRATINGKASGWQMIRTLKNNTTCYDTTAVTGGYYRYAIRAIRRTGAVTPLSVVKNENGTNSLFWYKNFARANGYYIFRNDYADPTNLKMLTLINDKNAFYSSNSGAYLMNYVDTNPNPEVSADSKGYSVVRVLMSGTGSGRVIRAVKTPVKLAVTNNTSGILFKWNKVDGATSYRVYRKLDSDRYWTFMGYTTNTYYPDRDVESGSTYVYTVRAVCNGHFSDYVRDGITITRLATPVLASAKSEKEGILVTWEGVEGAQRYNVYRKTAGNNWVMIGKVTDMKSTAYLDKSAKKGVTYTYTIRAVEGTDMSSYDAKGVTCKDLY